MQAASKRYAAIVAAAILGVVAMWCTRRTPRQWHANSGVVWTTEYHIDYLGPSDLHDSIHAVFERIDRSASVYNRASTISRVNRGDTLEADDILSTLYRASVVVHHSTDGAFDPTVMPLVNAWGFGYKSGTLPGASELDSLLQFVGLDKLHLERGHFVKADRRVQLDFSSIAKGLACDEVGRMLARNGVESYMVEIGGEIAARGTNRQDRPWHVSVDLPSEQADTVAHDVALVLAVDHGGVATSGSYRKYKYQDGKRISHIIDPRTGQAAVSDLLSVTVVADDCMVADAWATGLMVLDSKQVQQLTQTRSDLGVMTISTDTQGRLVVWSNARFAQLVVM